VKAVVLKLRRTGSEKGYSPVMMERGKGGEKRKGKKGKRERNIV